MAHYSAEEKAVFARKWAGFVSAIWLMVFSGSFAFSNYSQVLKEVLGINQQWLNWLSIARDAGDALGGMVAGVLSNYLPVWALLCVSAIFGVTGYGVQWLAVSQIIESISYWIVAIAAIAAGMCVAWVNTAVFNASVRNFTQNKGPVAGLFKACRGLSGAVFATLCSILFSSSASMYLLMMVTIPNIFCIVSAVFFRPVATARTQEEAYLEQKSLLSFNVIVSVLAVYIAILDFLPESFEQSLAYRSVAVSILAAIIAAPAFVPIILFIKTMNSGSPEEGGVFQRNDQEGGKATVGDLSDHDNNVDTDALAEPLLEDNASNTTERKSLNTRLKSRFSCLWCCSLPSSTSTWTVQGLGEDTSTLSLFKTWHYYVLYISLVFGCGSGLSFSNNLGQIQQSLGFSSANIFVSLFSLGNFFGRLASGNVSEYFLRLAGMPRPAWMGLAKVPMIVLFVWLSTGSMTSLYVGSLVIGFSHGSLSTLTIPIVSEFYGLIHFGTNFVLTVTYRVVGSYVFSSIAGYLYDRQAATGSDSSSLTCYGSRCYGTTFLIMAFCLTLGLAFDAILTIISMPLYQNLRASRGNQHAMNT